MLEKCGHPYLTVFHFIWQLKKILVFYQLKTAAPIQSISLENGPNGLVASSSSKTASKITTEETKENDMNIWE